MVSVAEKELPPAVTSEITGFFNAVKETLGDIWKIAKANLGDFLHQYLDEAGMKEGYEKWHEQVNKHPITNSVTKDQRDNAAEIGTALKKMNKGGPSDNAMLNVTEFQPGILDKEEMYLYLLQRVEHVREEKNRIDSPEKMVERWMSQITSLIKSTLPADQAEEALQKLKKETQGIGITEKSSRPEAENLISVCTAKLYGIYGGLKAFVTGSEKEMFEQAKREAEPMAEQLWSSGREYKVGLDAIGGANQVIPKSDTFKQIEAFKRLHRKFYDSNKSEQVLHGSLVQATLASDGYDNDHTLGLRGSQLATGTHSKER
jgi:hypothetical protein